MTEEQLVESLTAAGVVVRKGKLGSVLLVDFRSPDLDPDALSSLVDNGRSWSGVLETFAKCRELYLTGLSVDDGDIEQLSSRLSGLQVLDLESTQVTDRIFAAVESLPKLKMLVLTGTSVSEEAIRVARKRMIQTRIIKLA